MSTKNITLISETLDYTLVKSGVKCNSSDQFLVLFTSLAECADKCREITECRFFIFGIEGQKGECWWEKTKNRECPEGWEEDEYDFYEMIGKFQRITVFIGV